MSSGQLEADGSLDFIRPEQPGQQPGAVGLAEHARCRRVVFIHEVADEFFHQVFEGDDPGCAAVLVNHNCQLQTAFLEQMQQWVDGDGGRYEYRLNHHLPDSRCVAVHLGDGDRVLDVHETSDVIDVVSDHGEAGVACLAGGLDHRRYRRCGGHGVQAGPGCHDIRGGLC